jgi:succinoglycan biosynthesis transport protein ExoP
MLVRNDESYSTLDDEPAGKFAEGRSRDLGLTGGGATSLRSFWLIVRWRAWLIALVTVATVLLVASALVVMPPRYKATTVVLVDPRQPRVTTTEVLSGIGADAAAVESQVELIESSALAKRVIARLKLAEDPDFTTTSMLERITEGLLALLGRIPAASDEKLLNRLIYKFQSGLTVRRRGLTFVLEISYAASNPAKAALISGAVADAYLDDQRAAKADITQRASGWLGERIEAMRSKVRDAERAVADYKSANSMVDVTQGNKLISRQIEDLTQQLALARSRTADAWARLERVEHVTKYTTDPAALAEALQSPVIANLRAQLAETARADAENNALYGDRHPTRIGVRAQLEGIRRQIDNELARIVAGVRNDYKVAGDREKSLESELTNLKAKFAVADQANVRLHELEREAQATRALFEQFLSRAKETSEQQSLQIADARIISPALTPLKQDRPPMPVLLIASVVGGGILGLGLVLIMEHMGRGVRTGAEIEQLFSLPCLATLPWGTEPAPARRLFGWSSAHGKVRRGAADAAALFVSNAPLSAYAEGLRLLRTRLRRSTPMRRSEILVVVSALPGEGKSTFACNFALTAASSGTRTLLIDGDIYNASASRAFELTGPGLWEVLRGKASFWNTITQEAESSLTIMNARDPANVPSEADDFQEAVVANLLRDCSKHFDLVVIDSPAILSSPGSMPLVECADRAIMVVEWARTERQAVLEALSTLAAHARKVSGVVLNKVPMDWYRIFDNGSYRGYYAAYAKGLANPPKKAVAS